MELDCLPANVFLINQTDQIAELKTIILDRSTDQSDFVFHSDRLIRLVIEEGLNLLSYNEVEIRTPSNFPYKGIAFSRGNCGVSLCRSGEVMEQVLRQCCRSVRIGKMLVADGSKLLYARLVPDIASKNVFLLYPLLGTGETVIKAISALLDAGVLQGNILLLTLFTSPNGIEQVMQSFPKISIVTTDLGPVIPTNFTTKYFGTD